jgi:hypothetical protein
LENAKLDFMRDPASRFPQIESPEQIKKLRVWHCKYKSLKDIAGFSNLDELVIASYPDSGFEPLKRLKHLRYLTVVHAPKVHSLAPLAELEQLEVLSIATSPSWDASGRVLEVDSLEPLAKLPKLKHLELFGVCPHDRSLRDLERCPALQSLRVSQYSEAEVRRFRTETRIVDGSFNPKSSFDAVAARRQK